MSNLIPTPRPDKNGKIVTRHIKSIPAGGAKNIPAPFSTTGEAVPESPDQPKSGNFITRWQDRRRQKKAFEQDQQRQQQAIGTLVSTLFPNETEEYAGTTAERWKAGLKDLISTDELEMAVGLAKLVTREGVQSDLASKDQKQVLWALRGGGSKDERAAITVRLLHAHKDWLEKNPGEAIKLVQTSRALIELDLVDNGGRDGIKHLDEYMTAITHSAYQEFDIIHIWRKGYLDAALRYPDQLETVIEYTKGMKGFRDEYFDDYLRAVEKYPDKTEKMFEYFRERGEFNDGGFEQYMNTTTPLAGGAL